MKKIFTLAMMALLGMGSVYAADVTDELTRDLFAVTGNNYTSVTGISASSSAVYAAQMAGGNESIQLRSNNSNSGIITTASGGTVKSIKVEWNSNTADARTLDVYGSTVAYTAPTDLYGDNKGEQIASFTKSDGDKTITIDGNYQYVGFRSKSGAMYIDKITIVWEVEGGQEETKTATAIQFASDPDTRALADVPDVLKKSVPQAAVYAGETKISDADIIWNTSDASVTIDNNGVITATEQGTYTITASYSGNDTYKEASKSYTLKVYKVYENLHNMVEDVTSENAKWDTGELVFYMLYNHDTEATFTNTVAYVNGTSTYITDGTDFMLLYGTSGLTTGDVITSAVDLEKGSVTGIYGKLYLYNKLPEITLDAIDVTTTASGAKVDPVVITVDKLGENLNHYVTIQDAEYVSADGKNLTFKVGETSFIVRQNWTNVSIEGLEATAKYTLEGMEAVYKTTNQLYLISWTKTSEPTGISSVKAAAEFNGAIYNIAGQKVSASYKGLVIKNGKKIVQK